MEAPPSAVSLWLQGDLWVILFPDGQLIEIPAGAANRLQSILKARSSRLGRFGEPGRPYQENLDSWREKDDPSFEKETREVAERKAGARRRVEDEKRKEREVKKKMKEQMEREKLRVALEMLEELEL